MKHFLNAEGVLFAFEDDGSQDELISADLRPATDAEVWAIQHPAKGEAQVRAERDASLSATDWLMSRHRDEQALSLPPSLTELQFAGLLAYRQQLRELPADPAFPNVELPTAPAF